MYCLVGFTYKLYLNSQVCFQNLGSKTYCGLRIDLLLYLFNFAKQFLKILEQNPLSPSCTLDFIKLKLYFIKYFCMLITDLDYNNNL